MRSRGIKTIYCVIIRSSKHVKRKIVEGLLFSQMLGEYNDGSEVPRMCAVDRTLAGGRLGYPSKVSKVWTNFTKKNHNGVRDVCGLHTSGDKFLFLTGRGQLFSHF